MVFQGFSVAYVAVDEDETGSDSEEAATPFPGSLKSFYPQRKVIEDSGVI